MAKEKQTLSHMKHRYSCQELYHILATWHLLKLSNASDVQSKNVKIWWKRLRRSSSSIIQCNCFSRILNICITLFSYCNGKNSYVLSSEHTYHYDFTVLQPKQNSLLFSHCPLISLFLHPSANMASFSDSCPTSIFYCMLHFGSDLFLPYKSFIAQTVQVCQELRGILP